MTNDPQIKAINHIDEDIIISASAGSGKTYTLIERLKKRIIKDGISIDEVCALTFTEAAASEMKERLLSALNQERDKTNDPRLTQEISLVETAQITTIHGFCLNIIKNYGYILNLDPNHANNILDEGLVSKLKKEALDITLQEAYKKDDVMIRLLLDTFVPNPAFTKNLEDNILDSAKYLGDYADRDAQIAYVNSLYQSKTFDDLPREIQDGFFAYHTHHLTMIHDRANAFCNAFIIELEEHKAEVASKLKNAIASLKQLRDLSQEKNISFYEAIPTALNDIIIPSLAGKWSADLDKDRYNALARAIESCVKVFINEYEPLKTMMESLQSQSKIVEALLTISNTYLNNFSMLKNQKGGYDFDDLIRYALMILQHNDGYISNILKEHYEEVMVDEFQDTNDLQNSIVNAISRGNNTFRVGDLKQSIYGFQGARPALMKSLMHQDDSATIHFKYNYRSKANIVDYNNILFSNLMNTLAPNSYDAEDLASVKDKDFSGLPNIQNMNQHSVDFHIYQHHGTSILSYGLQHAMLISDTIYDMMHDNLTIDIRQGNDIVKEPLDFKHITVLVRGHAAKTFLKEAFDKANIPHNIVSHQGFFQSDVIKVTIDWMRFYLTKEDYYLVPLLNSPYINMSLDSISLLRIKEPTLSLYKALRIHHHDVYKVINDTFNKWDAMSLVDALIYLSTLNNAYTKLFSLQAKTNFDFLLEKAQNYQESSNPHILGFVDYIDALIQKSRFSDELIDRVSESRTLHKDANFVNVVTMHGSKGLQYPVTIVWPDKDANNRNVTNAVLGDDLFSLSIKDNSGPYNSQQTTFLRTLSTHKLKTESIQEYLRLFYVSLTRATHKLVIVDIIGNLLDLDDDLDRFLMYNFKSAAQLIAAASNEYFVYPRHVFLLNLDSYTEVKQFPVQQESGNTTLETFKLPNFEITEKVPVKVAEFNPDFISATNYGTEMHEAIEALPHTVWSSEQLSQYPPNIQKGLRQYNTHEITRQLYSYPTIEHEMPILYRDNDESKQGIIDFYALNDTEVVIVDFKTDNADVDTIINRYTSQLEAYKKALELTYQGLEIKAYIYSFYHNSFIPM